jgi:hypothetical protein
MPTQTSSTQVPLVQTQGERTVRDYYQRGRVEAVTTAEKRKQLAAAYCRVHPG